VPTKENPADCASRGLNADQLIAHDMWWNGPTFLKEDELPDNLESWYMTKDTMLMLTTEEQAEIDTQKEKWENCLTLEDALEMTLPKDENDNTNETTENQPQRYVKAMQKLIKDAQASSMNETMSKLKRNKIHKQHWTYKFGPFLDHNGIMRLSGRILNSKTITEDQKHPIVIDDKKLVSLVIEHTHRTNLHANPKPSEADEEKSIEETDSSVPKSSEESKKEKENSSTLGGNSETEIGESSLLKSIEKFKKNLEKTSSPEENKSIDATLQKPVRQSARIKQAKPSKNLMTLLLISVAISSLFNEANGQNIKILDKGIHQISLGEENHLYMGKIAFTAHTNINITKDIENLETLGKNFKDTCNRLTEVNVDANCGLSVTHPR
jgi:hypothetical protein